MGQSGCRLKNGLSSKMTAWSNAQTCLVTSVCFGQELISEKSKKNSIDYERESPSIIYSVS